MPALPIVGQIALTLALVWLGIFGCLPGGSLALFIDPSWINLNLYTDVSLKPFTIITFMVDIRQLYSYINLYTYDRDWRIVLGVKGT